MSKLQDIAERLIQEMEEKSKTIRKVSVYPTGDVQVYGESEFKVVTEDMDAEHEAEKVKFPPYLPARAGKKAFRKLDKEVKNGEFNVNDPDTLLDAKDYLVNEMLKKAGKENLKADQLAMSSYNEISNYYWDKVLEAEKKRAE